MLGQKAFLYLKAERRPGELLITNKDYFQTLEWLRGTWELRIDGKCIADGKLNEQEFEPTSMKVRVGGRIHW